jgi:hypothetical protein
MVVFGLNMNWIMNFLIEKIVFLIVKWLSSGDKSILSFCQSSGLDRTGILKKHNTSFLDDFQDLLMHWYELGFIIQQYSTTTHCSTIT